MFFFVVSARLAWPSDSAWPFHPHRCCSQLLHRWQRCACHHGTKSMNTDDRLMVSPPWQGFRLGSSAPLKMRLPESGYGNNLANSNMGDCLGTPPSHQNHEMDQFQRQQSQAQGTPGAMTSQWTLAVHFLRSPSLSKVFHLWRSS